MNFEIVDLESFDGDNGSLVSLESLKNIPLEPLSQNPVVAEWRAGKRQEADMLLRR